MENENVTKPVTQPTENKKTAQTSKNTSKPKPQVKKPKVSKALGMIETRGLVAAINAADGMLKSANVELIGTEKIGSGLVSVMVCGDVGAVKASVEAGVLSASNLGEIVASHVIARPHADVEKILPAVK